MQPVDKGYELTLVRYDPDSLYPNEWMLSFWATLTGLPRDEIWEACPPALRKDKGWGGRDMRELAAKLGLNCAPRFITFDPATPWPVVMRYKKTKTALARETIALREKTGDPKAKAPEYWYAAIYNRGEVWEPNEMPAVCQLTGWIKDHPNYHITSMLPIWWGDNLSLTKSNFE